MNSEHIQADRSFFTRWVLGTFAGWVLGFFLLILGIFAGELTGLQLENFAIGIGMGAGVGYTQGRIARPWLGAIWPWVWASVIGMGVPLLAFDIYVAVWGETSLALPLMIAPGGLLVGLLQRRILRSHFDRANWWVPA